MSQSTAPILMTGAVTLVNQSIFNGKPIDWSVPAATGAAAIIFALGEKAIGPLAVGMAWLAFAAVMLSTPSIGNPVINAARFFGAKTP